MQMSTLVRIFGLIILCARCAIGQIGSPDVVWQQAYGALGDDKLLSVVQTADGGFLFGGISTSGTNEVKSNPNYGTVDIWLVRTDFAGNRLWDVDYGGTKYNYVSRIRSVSSGGFIIAGSSSSQPGGNKSSAAYGLMDYWVILCDQNGGKIWEQSIGGSGRDRLYTIAQTCDAGFVVGGASDSLAGEMKTSTNFGGNDYWVVKMNQSGTALWDQSYGGDGDDTLYSMIQLADGGLLLGGYSQSSTNGNKTTPYYGFRDYWTVRLSAPSNSFVGPIWLKPVSKSYDEIANFGFQFNILATTNLWYSVEHSSDLRAWRTFSTIFHTNDECDYFDFSSTNILMQFYRAKLFP